MFYHNIAAVTQQKQPSIYPCMLFSSASDSDQPTKSARTNRTNGTAVAPELLLNRKETRLLSNTFHNSINTPHF